MTTVALVPAHRRADRVGDTVAALVPLVDEVVVIDDGSADGGATVQAARAAGARVVALPANRGKGGAVAAGVAAAPDADVYLLVDADTAATAAATAPLLEAVAAGADLAVGVLPPAGGRGGFGTVRRVARWGIRRACGFEAAAPLSGQRAVRGTLLRSLETADRFGLEVGMTVDAVRDGAVVVEVPVEVDHAHTGRGPAGFAHRAAQGYDLVRALWPRLLSERTRTAALLALSVVAVAALAATAGAAVPVGTPLESVDRVVLVAAPPTLRLDDLDDPSRPELAALAGSRGAVAAGNVDVPDRTPWSTWATVGAGRRLRAEPPTAPPHPDDPFLVRDVQAGQGQLGTALRAAGITTAFVGTEPTSAVRLALADGDGRIDRATTAGALGVAGLANQARTVLSGGFGLVAIDAAGLDGRSLDDLLGRLRDLTGPRTLLLLVTPADPPAALGLRPIVASGPGAPAGRLVSPSTRQDGLVVLTDVAPTVLDVLGVPVPEAMVGRPLRRTAGPPDVQGLVEMDQLARQRDDVWNRAFVPVGVFHAVPYGWAWLRWRRARRAERGHPSGHRGGGRGAAWLSWLALGLAGWPLATWLTRAVPRSGTFGWGAALVALGLDVAVVAAAWRLGRRRGLAPFALVVGATVLLVTLNLGAGGPLQLSSAFGNAAHVAGRATGLGNVAFSVYAGCALMAVACAPRRAPWIVSLLAVVASVDALPTLGADVGGAVTLLPVFVLAVAALWGKLRLRTAVVATGVTAAALAVAVAADLGRPAEEQTHLARFVTSGGRSSSIPGKVAQNLGTYALVPLLIPAVLAIVAFAVLLWRGRFRTTLPPGSPSRIGVAAALAVALIGNALNDSGPIVTLVVMSIVGPYLVCRMVAAEEPAPELLPPLAPTRPPLVPSP